MESRIRAGFTCYVSVDESKNINISYLKAIGEGLIPVEAIGVEEAVIREFPNIMDYLSRGYLMEIFTPDMGNMIVAMLGKHVYEGPYAEEEAIEDIEVETHSDVVRTLMSMDEALGKKDKNKYDYKRAYRLYGTDKYRLYPSRGTK